MTTLSAQQARDTKVFVINWHNKPEPIIEETTLFEHVCESAEKTTTPFGIGCKMFTREKMGSFYQKTGDVKKIITESAYEILFDEDREDYEYYGEGIVAWELCKWMPNGKAHVIDTYDTEEEANDEWYTRTYNCDFMPDDQRDTAYYSTEEEAKVELKERMNNQ